MWHWKCQIPRKNIIKGSLIRVGKNTLRSQKIHACWSRARAPQCQDVCFYNSQFSPPKDLDCPVAQLVPCIIRVQALPTPCLFQRGIPHHIASFSECNNLSSTSWRVLSLATWPALETCLCHSSFTTKVNSAILLEVCQDSLVAVL